MLSIFDLMPKTHAYDAVHELALDQHGVFTTAQARELGVHPKSVAAMARRGRLRRLSFGVYQDLGAPVTSWTEYMSDSFWPQGVRGVLSHETALSIMELSDANPARIHLTTPSGHRIRRARPPVLVLHWADLPEEARFAERSAATEVAVLQRADALRHRPLEAPQTGQLVEHDSLILVRESWKRAARVDFAVTEIR